MAACAAAVGTQNYYPYQHHHHTLYDQRDLSQYGKDPAVVGRSIQGQPVTEAYFHLSNYRYS